MSNDVVCAVTLAPFSVHDLGGLSRRARHGVSLTQVLIVTAVTLLWVTSVVLSERNR